MFKVQATVALGDLEADFPNYPDHLEFDLTADQRDAGLTLDQIIAEARSRANRELPPALDIKCITIEIFKENS